MMDSPALAPVLENVLYGKKDAIAYVTLNRPKVLSTLNQRTWQDLRTAFEGARDDASVRGVILTGAGDKAFIAGADISELAHVTAVRRAVVEQLWTGRPRPHREPRQAGDRRRQWVRAWGGLRIGQPEVKLGLIPACGATQRLERLIGKGRALQLILSGAMISAQEAYRIGLVNEVVPAAELITRAEAILKQIFANAPTAVRYSLEVVNRGLETSQAEGLALEAALFGLCAGTEDKKEGASAFLQKRAPQFQGR